MSDVTTGYMVGLTIESDPTRFTAEIVPPMNEEARLDELARLAFAGTDLGLGRTEAHYLPLSTILVGYIDCLGVGLQNLRNPLEAVIKSMLSPTGQNSVAISTRDKIYHR